MADAGPGGDTPPPPIPPTGEGLDATAVNDWLRRAVKGFFEEVYDSETNAAKAESTMVFENTELKAQVVKVLEDTLTAFINKVGDYLTAGTPIAAKLSAHTINQISGTNIDEEKVANDFAGSGARANIVDIGKQFGQVIEKMFPIDGSVINNRDRADRQFAIDNLDAYFGTNLNFQLRSLAIGTVASFFPGFNLRQFENLHQSINWAYGFGWLSWSVLSAVMGATTTKPLTEYYNARIKGNDFSEAEAMHAYVQKRIDLDTLNKVLDNQGMRDDIRPIRIEQTRTDYTAEQAVKGFIQGHISPAEFNRAMDAHGVRDDIRQTRIDMERPDLTEGDLQEGYENGLFSAQDVQDHYKEKGYDGFNLQAKADLIADHRLFQLRQKLATAYHHGYVLGTVTQDEYSQYLSSINFTGLEIDMELKRAEIEARVHIDKKLTRAEVIRLAAHGGLDPQVALQKLLDMGLVDADARMLLADAILEHAVQMIPTKIRNDCLTPQFEQNIITTGLTVALQLDPTYAARNKDYVSFVQCIISNYASTIGGGGGGGGQPPGNAPAAPQFLVGIPVSGGAQMSWQPVPGVTGYQVYRRIFPGGSYSPVGALTTQLSFTDSGLAPGATYVYVVRSVANGVESVNSNEINIQVVA